MNKGRGQVMSESGASPVLDNVFSDKEYKIIREIGSGSFGKAYLCEKKGRKYVMKRINMKELSDEEKQGALNEAQVLQKLKHDNIIAYHEYFISSDKFLNIVMDYADGGDLFTKIKTAPTFLPEEIIIDWFCQIALGLKHVHDCNILHRDLKTQNIFLTKSGRITIGDFGIAKILNSQTEFASTVIGTPYYLSPELCEDKPYNSKSDVWALGCVLYEITTRKHAFNGQNLPALVLKILKGTYPPIPSFYSKNLSSVISSMLQKDPELRPSIGELLSLPFIQEKVLQIIRKRDSLKAQQLQPSAAATEIVKTKPQSISPKLRLSPQQQQQQETSQSQPQQQPTPQSSSSVAGASEEKSKWLEGKQSELDAIFKQLHPSKQNPINTINRLQIRKQIEEKDEKKKEKQKGRKEYYEQILEKRKGSISVSASVQHPPMQQQQQQQPPPNIPPRISLPTNPPRNNAMIIPKQTSNAVEERVVVPSKTEETRSKSTTKNVVVAEESTPRIVNIAGEDKMVFRLDEIKNQAHNKKPSKPPPKPQPVVISQQNPQQPPIAQPQQLQQQPQSVQPIVRSKDDERKEIKKKQEKDRQEWLIKNGVQPDDKKKKFLAEKQDEKKRRKEEERKKMMEHKKKMDAIKGRKNQIKAMFGMDDQEPEEDESPAVAAAVEVLEPTPEELQKKKEEEDKERVRREKADKERQNFRDFIKNQKKKKKDDAPPPFQVATTILESYNDIEDNNENEATNSSSSGNSFSSSNGSSSVGSSNNSSLDSSNSSSVGKELRTTVVISPKQVVTPTKTVVATKRVSPPLVNKTNSAREVLILEPKSKPETPKKLSPKSSSSSSISSNSANKINYNYSIEDDLDLLPTREGKVPELSLTPSTLDREAGLVPDLKFHTPVKQTVDISQMSPNDLENLRKKQHELSVRIEALRNYCEQKFGEKSFIQIYNLLRDFEFKDNEDEDSQIQEGILRILGNNTRLLPYVQKIHQLIFCEDLFYG